MENVIIIGGGICGLALALNLHSRGIGCRVFERAEEVKELGVGITVLPHAMREFVALGVGDQVLAAGIETEQSCFFNRFGQLIYKEPRGKYGGNPFKEVAIHRGRLHRILYEAAVARLGSDRVRTNHSCVRAEQSDAEVTAFFTETSSGRSLAPVSGEALIACDGVNSVVRKHFYPNETVAFSGINTWRGVTRRKPIIGGRSYMRVGSIFTGKMVIYPIIDKVDDEGNQLINWMAEIQQNTTQANDWNKPGQLADFYSIYESWRFDWLDVADMISKADQILEYPMVDKDPVAQWTFGRVTFAGDAAHPMYPRGSNGMAQSSIDARTLADCLQQAKDPRAALIDYESKRREVTANVVRTNRTVPPDFINIKVEELVGDRPFDDLDKYITQAELRQLSENYKKVAGYALTDLGAAKGH